MTQGGSQNPVSAEGPFGGSAFSLVKDVMMKNTALTGIAAALAGLCLGALMAGFVPGPGPRAPEWRGRMVSGRAGLRLPFNPVMAQAVDRRRLSRVEEKPAAASDAAHAASSLYLEGWTVGMMAESDPVTGSLEHDPALPPLPASGAPGLAVASLTDGGDAPGGESPRWVRQAAGGPVCAMLIPLTLDLPESSLSGLSMAARAARYQDTVNVYARKYGLDASLVMAIMQVESGFNPTLISSRNAHGLMQVVPATAGDEVHRWLGRSGRPTASELLNPDNNIRYGVSYLYLLRTRHLEGIRDPRSLEYCVVASYNGGSGAVLRHFGRTRDEAFAAINALSPHEVLARLTQTFPAWETRAFVRKVLALRPAFYGQGGMLAEGETAREAAPVAVSAGSDSVAEVEKLQRAQLDAMRQGAGRNGSSRADRV